MSRYLVTGGCGFIGAHLSRELIHQGHEVFIIDNLSNGKIIHPEAKLFEVDITRFHDMNDLFKKVDGCFHLAAIPTVEMELEQWFWVHEVNLDGSLNVFRAAIDAGKIPVVYASSCGVYGDSVQLPLKESQVIHPLSAYGCDKYATELNAYFLNHVYRLPSMGLRIFNVFGPGQRPDSPYSGVITHFINQIQTGKPITIYGDGKQTRDFVFINDVVNILIQAMSCIEMNADVVNICTGKNISIYDLAHEIAGLYGLELNISYAPQRLYDVLHSRGDPTKMHDYGFSVQTNLQEGLQKTIESFRI